MNRRKVLLASGVALSTTLAGCSGDTGDENGDGNGDGNDDETGAENGDGSGDGEEESGNGDGSENGSEGNTEEEAEPSISVTGATLQADRAEVGKSVDVDIDLENTGGAEGDIDLKVTVNGTTVIETTETVGANSEVTISKTISLEAAGDHEIAVNGVDAGVLTVEAPAPESYTFSGSGASVEQGIDLEGGLTVVDATHTGGSSNFQVSLVNDSEFDDLFVNAIGEYDGASANLLEAGEYVLDVEADGDWEVEIRQPRAASGDALPQSLSGNNPAVAGPFEFSGTHIATGSHSGESNFQATVYPAEGMFGELVFNEIGEYEGETAFNFDGVGWVDVMADGQWEIELE